MANATLGGTTYLANCSYKGVKANKKDFIASTVIGGVMHEPKNKILERMEKICEEYIVAQTGDYRINLVMMREMYKAKVTGIKQNIHTDLQEKLSWQVLCLMSATFSEDGLQKVMRRRKI